MAATIVWIGGIFFQAVVLAPALSKATSSENEARFLEAVRRRFDPLAWLSLAILIATGLTQMSANPNYSGFLVIGNLWSVAILSKHIVIGVMILVASYQTWVLYPELNRNMLARAARAEAGPGPARLNARQTIASRLNLVLGIIVLALTAIARTA
jgi:uncharacterized membrane protein